MENVKNGRGTESTVFKCRRTRELVKETGQYLGEGSCITEGNQDSARPPLHTPGDNSLSVVSVNGAPVFSNLDYAVHRLNSSGWHTCLCRDGSQKGVLRHQYWEVGWFKVSTCLKTLGTGRSCWKWSKSGVSGPQALVLALMDFRAHLPTLQMKQSYFWLQWLLPCHAMSPHFPREARHLDFNVKDKNSLFTVDNKFKCLS